MGFDLSYAEEASLWSLFNEFKGRIPCTRTGRVYFEQRKETLRKYDGRTVPGFFYLEVVARSRNALLERLKIGQNSSGSTRIEDI